MMPPSEGCTLTGRDYHESRIHALMQVKIVEISQLF